MKVKELLDFLNRVPQNLDVVVLAPDFPFSGANRFDIDECYLAANSFVIDIFGWNRALSEEKEE